VDDQQFAQLMTRVMPYLTPPEQSVYLRLFYESDNLMTRMRYDDLARSVTSPSPPCSGSSNLSAPANFCKPPGIVTTPPLSPFTSCPKPPKRSPSPRHQPSTTSSP